MIEFRNDSHVSCTLYTESVSELTYLNVGYWSEGKFLKFWGKVSLILVASTSLVSYYPGVWVCKHVHLLST